jgi:hypothetical protein
VKLPIGPACLAIFAGFVLAAGCAFIKGLWSGDTPSFSTCAITHACSRDDVQTSRATVCVGRDDQDRAEGDLRDKALTAMRARGCKEPRAWASCWADLVPCGP